jgi:hypothetical protein
MSTYILVSILILAMSTYALDMSIEQVHKPIGQVDMSNERIDMPIE